MSIKLPKYDFTRKMNDFDMILKWFLQKLPNNVGNLGKLIVAAGFEWLPKSKNSSFWSHCL